MRRSVLALSLAAVALFAVACNDNIAPKVNRSIGVAHVPARSVGTTQSGATLTTDADDYAPGQTLTLTGAGWPAGDVVAIHLDESPQNHPPVDWTVTADASGAFTDGSYVVQASDAAVTFTITATSGSTGEVAAASFTDTPLGAGSLCANVAGFGDAVCPTANGATGVFGMSHYAQKVGTAATYQIIGATDAFASGACAPGIDVTVRNTTSTINSTICGSLAGSTITFSVQLPSDKCGTAAVSYSTNTIPVNANNDIILDGAKNGVATTLGGIAPADASGKVIVPIVGTGACPVQPPPPTTSCVSITAVQGVAITPVTMVGSGGSGGPYTFYAIGLPAGITMASNGTISGTPTVSGTFSYSVTVTDNSGHSGTINCSVTVSSAPPPTASCVSIVAVQGSPITPVTMVGSGGTGGPYTFSATGLPSGVSMSSSGTISGTPTVSGTFNYTVTVKDNAGHTGTVNCSVTVNPPPTATCVGIVAVQGFTITPVTMTGSGGTGGPYTFSATGLPAGLTMSSNGTISGTPTMSGTFNYTVTVTDAAGHTGTVNCSVTVNPPPTASCVSITAVQGSPITPVTMVGSGGTGGPYTFSATGLPAGLSMASNGTISGTPTVSGTFSYTVTVTDNTGHTGTINCSVTVTTTGKTFSIGPSSMEGAILIANGDWVNGGYSFSFVSNAHLATNFSVHATVTLSGPCVGGGPATDTFTFPLNDMTFSVPAGNTSWLPTGDQNSVLSWQGSVVASGVCGGIGKLNASKGAVFTATVSQSPSSGSLVNFRFKYRDPAAKGKPNTNCLDTSDPNRAKADVCGASWSQTVRDP